jgi:hypothetical protein
LFNLPVSEFLKPYGARCGVEKGTHMGGLLGRKEGCFYPPRSEESQRSPIKASKIPIL